MLLVTMVAEAIMSSAYDTDDSEDESGTFMDPKTGRVSVRHSRRAYFSPRGKCPKYPDIEPGEDGALAAYRTWDKGLRDWIEENELESLLREDSGSLPEPSPPSGEGEEEKEEEKAVVKPEPPTLPAAPDTPTLPDPPTTAEGLEEYQQSVASYKSGMANIAKHAEHVQALQEGYLEALEAYHASQKAAPQPQPRASYKYRKWRLKQKALRMELKKSVSGSISLSNAVDRVGRDVKNCGTMVYFSIVKEVMSMYDDDAVSATQNEVSSRIQPFDDTAAVKAFITEYRVFYRDNWCSLFVPTAESAKPWLLRVPESLLVSKFITCLPSTPEWDAFRMADGHGKFKDDLAGLFTLVIRKCNIILRGQGSNTTKVVTITTKAGKKKDVAGPHLKCNKCIQSGVREGPLTQHTPYWDGCPHHKEVMAKRTRGTGRKGKDKSKGKPSKDRPCNICGSPSHWANKCPEKKESSNKDDNKKVEDAGIDMAAIATGVAEAVTGALTPFTQALMQQQERILAAVAPQPPQQRQLANAPWGSSAHGGQGSGHFGPGPNSSTNPGP